MKYNIAQPKSIAYIVLVSEPQPICGLNRTTFISLLTMLVLIRLTKRTHYIN